MERKKSGPICILIKKIFFIKLKADTETAPNPRRFAKRIRKFSSHSTCMHWVNNSFRNCYWLVFVFRSGKVLVLPTVQPAWHQKLKTGQHLTTALSVSSSKFTAVVADVTLSVTNDPLPFSVCLLFAICIDYDITMHLDAWIQIFGIT